MGGRTLGFRVCRLAMAVAMVVGVWPVNGVTAEDRVALVIGNSAYQHTTPLTNPGNDARAMADLLARLDFEVVQGRDLDKRAMESLLRQFGQQAGMADVALVFYAGHALQVGGENYLLPIDARLTSEGDLKWEAIPLAFVMEEADRAARLRLILLDACRDNPLAEQMARSVRGRSASVGRGLAIIDTTSTVTDTLIAYATEAGAIADDGRGRNSPFTEALLEHLPTPGKEIRLVMGDVRDAVSRKIHGRQIPWVNASLGGTEYILAPGSTPSPAPSPTVATRPEPAGPASADLDLAFWNSVKDSGSVAAFEAYLRRFPEGVFADLAHLRIQDLKAPPAPNEPAVAARTADPEPQPGATAQVSSLPPGRFPEASIRRLRAADLARLSTQDLAEMRNEIYARHGYVFRTARWSRHFQATDWYRPNPSGTVTLTPLEQANVAVIQAEERSRP
jgi:hypothetical protein